MSKLSKSSISDSYGNVDNVAENNSTSKDIGFSFHVVSANSEEIVELLAKYPKEGKNLNGFVGGKRGEFAKRIGSKISDYMAINKYSEKEFAEVCGISRTTLRKILNAEIHEFESTLNTYQKIATKGLGITLIELLKKGEI